MTPKNQQGIDEENQAQKIIKKCYNKKDKSLNIGKQFSDWG